MNYKNKCFAGLCSTAVFSLSLFGTPAHAAKPSPNLLEAAETICAADNFDATLESACELLYRTDGGLIQGNGCPGDDAGTGFVDYAKRNCSDNREAQRNKAASSVVAIKAWIDFPEKTTKKETAITKLCAYADKYALLFGAGKVIPYNGIDLGADALDIANELEPYACD